MKNVLLTAVLLLFMVSAYAQQEQQYTQFMYNKLAYNPAYAGSNNTACITGLYRNQWLGIEGAPQTQLLSFNAPINNNRVGVGLNLNRNTVGISERWTVDGAYAYRVPMGRGYLGLGLQASVRYMSNNYNDPRLIANTDIGGDGSIPTGLQDKFVPNFGVGAYYNTEKFYLGVSLPRLLLNNIDFNDLSGQIGEEVHHIYFMSGIRIGLTEKIDVQPQLLLKYATNSPFDADLNLSFIYNDRLTAGVSYRVGGSSINSGESIDFLVGAQINEHILLGLAYDATLSELKEQADGTIELVLRYCLGGNGEKKEDFVNPRFF